MSTFSRTKRALPGRAIFRDNGGSGLEYDAKLMAGNTWSFDWTTVMGGPVTVSVLVRMTNGTVTIPINSIVHKGNIAE